MQNIIKHSVFLMAPLFYLNSSFAHIPCDEELFERVGDMIIRCSPLHTTCYRVTYLGNGRCVVQNLREQEHQEHLETNTLTVEDKTESKEQPDKEDHTHHQENVQNNPSEDPTEDHTNNENTENKNTEQEENHEHEQADSSKPQVKIESIVTPN